MSTTTRSSRYQEGSIDRVPRAKGGDVWVYRWRELQEDGTRVQRKKTIGDVTRFPTEADVKREVENLRSEINAKQERIGKTTVGDAWGHFQLFELRDPDVDRSPTTVKSYLDYFKSQILPVWKDVPLDDVKSVAVEQWLRKLDLAPGTKAKIRNHLSAVFAHCIRHELYTKLNPIASVRQSAVRQSDPDILTLDEMKSIIGGIESQVIRVMVAVATASALRRSELRGLKFSDLNFDGLWFQLRRGIVNKDETKLKTKASRKGVPMNPELAEMLQDWRSHSPYPTDDDWVFASPFTEGKRPYWPDAAMKNHVRPAATAAGITKTIGWHTFRHSVGSHLGQSGENVKVVQELLRYASSRITQDVYQQADQGAKRSALLLDKF
jgi:integrase